MIGPSEGFSADMLSLSEASFSLINNADDATMVRAALERLRVILGPVGNEDAAIASELPLAIVAAMRRHPTEPGVQEAASGVLTNICGSSDEKSLGRAQAIHAAGAFGAVSAAVAAALAFIDGDHSRYKITDRSYTHPEVSMVIVEGCAMLATCAAQSAEMRAAVLQAGALPAWLLQEKQASAHRVGHDGSIEGPRRRRCVLF